MQLCLQKKIIPAFLALLMATGLCLATPSNAEAGTGFDIGAGIGWHGAFHHKDVGHFHGFSVRLAAGYRFKDWIGVYINQDLGGHWHGHHHGYFAGTTILSADFFLPFQDLTLIGLIGVGADYHNYDLVENGAFALRLGIGAEYMIKPNFGIGANFDYTLGANDHAYHMTSALLHFRYSF